MKIINNSNDARSSQGTVVVMGKFDGVHQGHRFLLEKAVCAAEELGALSVAFTFDRNFGASRLITTNQERGKLLEQLGLDVLVEYPFAEIMGLDAESFVHEILVDKLNMKMIIAGSDCGFGRNRGGNATLLRKMGDELGFEVEIVEKCLVENEVVSSTLARQYIEAGEIEKANEILGYEFFLQGEVVRGNQIGRTWDFPTINMLPDEGKIMPPNGVYASRVMIDGEWLDSVTNIGRKPTVDSKNEVILAETYIFDYEGNLYGQSLDVKLYHFIRAEAKFGSFDELKKQIAIDCEKARAVLEGVV